MALGVGWGGVSLDQIRKHTWELFTHIRTPIWCMNVCEQFPFQTVKINVTTPPPVSE